MPEIVGLLLAAGEGHRFGSQKLLHVYRGLPVILHSAASLSPCDRVVAVVRSQDLALHEILRKKGIEYMLNPEAQLGMGNSIAYGVRATEKGRAWCILPADMPWVRQSTTRRIVTKLKDGAPITAPFHQGRRGHPVGFSRTFHNQLLSLTGDSGARDILMMESDQVAHVDVDDPGIFMDIDTPEDLTAQIGSFNIKGNVQ